MAAIARSLSRLESSGRGALLLIAAEAGMGKSRLAAEALDLAKARGLRRMVGGCAGDGATAYQPFAVALRRWVRVLDQATIGELFAPPATLAAVLVPEIARSLDIGTSTPTPDDLAAAVWQLLRRVSRPDGAVLLLEDLHWADTDSLRMLSSLVREIDDLPVLIVGTYRPDEMHRRHPLQVLLTELGRERRLEQIRLAPLSSREVAEMLAAIFDGTVVGEDFARAVFDRTGGNPFFIEELMTGLIGSGEGYRAAGDWRRVDLSSIHMPLTVRDALLHRTRTLSDDELEILKFAAVAGEVLEVDVLAAATKQTIEAVEAAIRAGLRLQILSEANEGALTTYVFRHALTREALAEELVGPDRQRARAAIANAVVAARADELPARASVLADHFTAAGEVGKAIEYGILAARTASATFATDEAGRQWDRALGFLGPDAPQRLDLLLEAAEGVVDAADRRLAIAFATEARRRAHSANDPIREARAVHVLENERYLSGDGAGALVMCQQAYDLVRGRDDYAEATALRNLTRRLTLMDRGDEATELVERGISLAHDSSNSSALSGLHGTRMLTTPLGPDFDAAYSASLAAALAANDVEAERNATTNAGYSMLWGGELYRSREAFARAHELGERYAPIERYVGAGYAWLLALIGDYDRARALGEQTRGTSDVPSRVVALTALYEVADRTADPMSAAIAAELGELASGTSENQRIAPALASRARELLHADGIEAALPVFLQVLETTTYPDKRVGSHWMFSPECAAALAAAGLEEEVREWLTQIDRLTGNDRNPHNVAAWRLCEAHQAVAAGRNESARELFADAIRRYNAMPCPARETEAWLGLADLEWTMDTGDASERAARSAHEIATRVGAVRLQRLASVAIERTAAPAILATVMVTDIIGSTEKAATLGDRGWRELLDRHHAAVRRELARFDGREIDTAGDGFLAAFASPAQAVRCASACRASVSRLGLEVRIGLHSGECQQSGDKLTGIAVHVAARIAASAEGGQILTSGTVRDLLAGSGVRFIDAGDREFKGLPGPRRVFAVDA